MNLEQCLDQCSWHHLRSIAYGRGLVVPYKTTRADLRALLQADLGRPGALAAEVAALPTEACAALQILALHNGWLPAPAFCRRFGPLRTSTRGRDDPAVSPPWRQPTSATERLWYRGLLYTRRRPRRRQDRETSGFVLPEEIIPLLPPPPALFQPIPPPQVSHDPPPLLYNLVVFLAHLSACTCSPRHGRWLTPRDFRPLLDRLLSAGCSWIAADRRARGERPTRVLRTLHFLAEATGFLAQPPLPARRYGFTAGRPPQGERRQPAPLPRSLAVPEAAGPAHLVPTLLWHEWLARPPADQFAALRRALLAQGHDPEQRWRAYRFPGWQDTQPLALLHRLAEALRGCPSDGDWLDLEAFLAGLSWRSMELAPAPPSDEDPQRSLLTGFLAWLGLVQLDHPYCPTCFRLTPPGAALLGHPGGGEPQENVAPLRLAATAPDALAFTVAPEGPPALLYRLAVSRHLQWAVPGRVGLSPDTLAGTPEQELADLVRLLDANLEGPLPVEVVATLQRWAHDGPALSLHPAIILEARDPELLAELAGRRGLRRYIRRALGRRAVEIDARATGSLLRKLRRFGLSPVVPVPLPSHERPVASYRWGLGDAGHLLLTAQLYNRLPAHFRPTHAVPQAALERLAAGLGPLEIVGAAQLATETLDRLLDALDGRLLPPPSTRPAPGVLDQTLALIRRALAEERPLELAYYTAGRNELTHRTVEPLRLEERGGVLYLVAYCHMRQEERTFRVDRIAQIQVVDQPGASH